LSFSFLHALSCLSFFSDVRSHLSSLIFCASQTKNIILSEIIIFQKETILKLKLLPLHLLKKNKIKPNYKGGQMVLPQKAHWARTLTFFNNYAIIVKVLSTNYLAVICKGYANFFFFFFFFFYVKLWVFFDYFC
jgi:hypothetical protein